MTRQEFLTEVAQQFLHVRTAWIDGDTPYLTEEFEASCDDLIASFAEGEIPAELRKAERVVGGELAACWSDWKRRAANAEDNTLLPTQDFWRAVERLEAALEAAYEKPVQAIETIEELRAQKVSDQQICQIYGWLDRRGAPEIWRLREELAEPGKHTQNWVNPHERARQEREAREAETIERIRQRQRSKLKALTEPCQETIQQLVEQGLCVAQIVTMRKCTVAEVFEECDRLGIDHPPMRYQDVRTARAPAEPGVPEATERAMAAQSRGGRARREGTGNRAQGTEDVEDEDTELLAEEIDGSEEFDGLSELADDEGDLPAEAEEAPGGAMTLEQEIVAYHHQQMTAGEIAKAVSQEGREVSAQKVNAVLRRYQRDPAAFA